MNNVTTMYIHVTCISCPTSNHSYIVVINIAELIRTVIKTWSTKCSIAKSLIDASQLS